MQWDSYPAVKFAGVRYGLKSDSFQKYVDLPSCTQLTLELAVGSSNAPRSTLLERGWALRDPIREQWEMTGYQQYIQDSAAEFTVAKQGYVVARSGWFSERSAAYLASGRPVVTEDTGFASWLPVGDGVLPFRNFDEAVVAIKDVGDRYDHHCRHARRLAREYFDAKKVLTDLIHAI
jgi:hypothetical protein